MKLIERIIELGFNKLQALAIFSFLKGDIEVIEQFLAKHENKKISLNNSDLIL